jgi:hypothetical protein
MTENEKRHFDKLYNRLMEFNSKTKLKNKAVLRFLDLISYLFTVATYEFKQQDNGIYIVTFDISVNDTNELFRVKHFVGYGNNNTSLAIEFSHNGDFSYFNGYNGKYTKGSIFVGNRTRKNLMANIKRVFENIPDQIKCEMYFRGMKIAYDIND